MNTVNFISGIDQYGRERIIRSNSNSNCGTTTNKPILSVVFEKYFKEYAGSIMRQAFLYFIIALILSPFAGSVLFLIVFYFIYELIYYIFSDPSLWCSSERIQLVFVGFSAVLIGRSILGVPPIVT